MKKRQKIKIILASASPRRKKLLRGLLKNFGLNFVVKPSNIAEYIPQNSANFGKIVMHLALLKAKEAAKIHSGLIISADTIVVHNGRVLGKPSGRQQAVKMLKQLSGKKHKVFTGLCMINTHNGSVYKTYEATGVKFRKLLQEEIEFYVSTGASLDKAGSYGIQDDYGSTFVERIEGDYFNVVGLPIVKTYSGLIKMTGGAVKGLGK